MPILTEASGKVRFGDIITGRTMTEKVDPVTGKASMVIVEYKDTDLRPRVSIKDGSGKTAKIPGTERDARYILPLNAILTVSEGDMVAAGHIIAKIPRETTKTKDITGGLPRVAELFEVRKPKEAAVISEIDGYISFSKGAKGKRKVTVTPGVGDKKEYLIPKGKHIGVHEGDYIRAGEPLMEGSINPHDILNVLGLHSLARYLVDEVQEVYRLQGVRINDKHIEVIVRQMVKRVRVIDPGDTEFLLDEQVERQIFEDVNEKIVKEGGNPATAEPLLLGITKASLSTESFISAASFQETTKVLSEAAVTGKVDTLRGLKENVIMGRIIPSGTGVGRYRNISIETVADHTQTETEAGAVAGGNE
jgi:DNA-directed RNA polymerase subunit beta'